MPTSSAHSSGCCRTLRSGWSAVVLRVRVERDPVIPGTRFWLRAGGKVVDKQTQERASFEPLVLVAELSPDGQQKFLELE
jgi:hypothetical protein